MNRADQLHAIGRRYVTSLGAGDFESIPYVENVEFRCRIDAMSCTLRIIDRFTVNDAGEITSQENFFDPRDVTNPGWRGAA